MDALINYLENYSSQVLIIQIGFLFIISAIFLWVWFYNRKKYNHLKHQIPASVVKSYLDSIIQNSTALKSSLFRGGGLDVDSSNIPSVMPVSDLPSGAPANVDPQELSELKAQISNLESQLDGKKTIISDLEDTKTTLEGDVKAKQTRIEDLEKQLAEGGGDSEQKVVEVAAERDKLKETLAQYSVIEDDLANLKRLMQENEQLKKALAEGGGSVPPPAQEAAPPTQEEAPPAQEAATPAQEEAPIAEEEAPQIAAEAPAAEATPEPPPPSENNEEKSPEDLLSEFEKMLG